MQIYRLNKDGVFNTRAVIITHMDLDGIVSGYLCDLGVRVCAGFSEDQVQIVGDYSPEPRTTLGLLKQVLYKLPVDERVSIFVLDRANIDPKEIIKLIEDGWIKPNWRITCIDHHTTNFAQEDYDKLKLNVNQIVNPANSAAMNVMQFFETLGVRYSDNIKEITRLTSIYDRFAWLTEDISKEDENKAKYLNRICGINHRMDFWNMLDNSNVEELLELGRSASEIIKMMINKIYKELLDDKNDFLIHKFTNKNNENMNIVFIRRDIEYIYVSELSELIFDKNDDIHMICYLDPKLGGLSLRSRESGKYLDISSLIKTLGLKGGGHPGAGGYFGYRNIDKKTLIDKLYFDQAQLLTNFLVDLNLYFESIGSDFKYSDGELFYGFEQSCKEYLDKIK